MATRSKIAIENQNGTVTSIYCHWDGGIESNGRMLIDNYNTTSLNELVELGNISSLGITPDDTIAFCRDRGEDLKFETYPNVETLFEDAFNMGIEYVYCLTKDELWLVSDGGPVVELQVAIEEGY